MKYLAKKFSSRASTKAYRDNFDATFGKKPGRWEDLKKKHLSPERIRKAEAAARKTLERTK